MRKLLTITSLLLGLITARAEVLLVEDFDYTIGKTLTECGDWYLQFENNEDQIVISNGLELTGYAQSGIGNGVLLACKSGSAIPHIQLPNPVTSGCVYVAMMIQATLPTSKSGWIMSFRDNVITSKDYNENGRLLIDSKNHLGISVAGPSESTNGYTNDSLDTQNVYLAVLKYEIKPGSNNDETSLYVLDSVCSIEPQTPDVGPLSDATVADIAPANLLLRGFDANAWILVDGIRVATTWAEALGVKPTSLGEVNDAQCTMHSGRKVVRNGQLVIEQDGCLFNVLGMPIQ